ncbi:MAG TPA: TetR/AcrR family transcriptional regulator [Cellvibrionaceae bacterium]
MNASESSREMILAAARELFYQRGYQACSMGDIAKAAGLYKGNLSYYYKTKADLLAAVAAARMQSLTNTLALISSRYYTSREQLLGFVAMVEGSAPALAQYGCPLGSLATELGKHSPELQPYAQGLLVCIQQWLATRFAQSPVPGQDADVLAEQMLVTAQGIAVMAQATQNPALVQRQCQQMRQWLESSWPA